VFEYKSEHFSGAQYMLHVQSNEILVIPDPEKSSGQADFLVLV
jgi:hypothetical protein